MNLVPAQRVPAWRQKYNILRIFLRARFRRFGDRAMLEAYQERRIQQMLTNILPRSPHTAQRLPNQDVRRWREMPIIGKAEMMEHFDTLNTAGLHLQDAFDLAAHAEDNRTFEPTLHGYTVGLSSGTSGSRGVFVVSPSERALWAGEQLAHWLPAIPWKKERIAFFLRANSQLYGTLGSRHIHFQFFDLVIPLEQHIDTLNRMNPTFLTGPPSVLAWLARQQKRGHLHIRPHTIIASAEVLDDLDARQITHEFGVPVRQVYQATEGLLGLSCPHGAIHLAEFGVHFGRDWVDHEAGLFSPIVTDFSRTTQPIIRYRMNDLLQLSNSPCPCGSPYTAIRAIHGRADDIFHLPHRLGSGTVRIFPDYIRRSIVMASPDIRRYRAILEHDGTLHIELDTTPGTEALAAREVSRELNALFTRYSARPPALRFHPCTSTAGLNKLKRVECRRHNG